VDFGSVRLYRLEGVEGGGTCQVESGIDRQGDLVVMVRLGLIVAALEPAAAHELGTAILAEVEAIRLSNREGLS
jgi:hypothetical protein